MTELHLPERLPRSLHPGAWWAWALGLAAIAAWTTNPLLLGLVIGVTALVVMARREDAPWGRSFDLYLRIGLLVVIMRVVLRVAFAGSIVDAGQTVLVTLPELPLPGWVSGIRIGGPVTAEAVVAALADGLRLAAILVCFGAANSLANPKRLLRILPNALYEIGAAVSVALSVAPQLAESVVRVRRAQLLRSGRRASVRRTLLPVLADALDRSVALAAAMDARGYGRAGSESTRARRTTGTLLLVGLLGVCIGIYGLLDATTPAGLGASGLVGGGALLSGGLVLAGRRTRHTRYRPDRWLGAEWLIVAIGATSVACVAAGAGLDPASLAVQTAPLTWPTLPILPAIGIMLAAVPAVLAPIPPLRAAADAARRPEPARAALDAGS